MHYKIEILNFNHYTYLSVDSNMLKTTIKINLFYFKISR